MLARGTLIGPYEIVAPIGAGGMGEVYRAHDGRLRRDVAIKVLAPAFASDPERLHRFELEARAAGSLSHPNIVTVHDFGIHEGTPYIVSELLLGETLRERLERGPLPVRLAIEFAIQIARGLSAAHQKGIVHRDLKPENVYLTDDGRLKILDFGLAKPLHAKAAMAGSGSLGTTVIQPTEPGVVFGTVGYMSPEQVRGLPADNRSDIFSLGLIIFEMLTGRRAFQGESSVETMSAILKDDLPELTTNGRQIPPGLDRVVRHCAEKSPEDRFQSARDLAFALEALSGLTAATDLPRRRGRLRIQWRKAGALAAALVIGLALGALLLRRAPADPPAFRYLTYSGHDYSPAASPDGRFVAFTSERDGTPRIWLKQLPGGEEQPLTSGPDDFARFSPDGALVLFARTANGVSSLYRVGVLGGEPRRVIDDASEGDWSPDGARIAFVRQRQNEGRVISVLGTVAADGSGVREIAEFPDRNLGRPRWSPGGGTIAAVELGTGSNRPVWLVSPDGKSRQELPGTRVISSVAWVNDGREVLYFENESALEGGLGVSAGAANVIRRGVPFGSVERLSWSPSGSMVLDVLAPGTVVFDSCSPRASLREFAVNGSAPVGARWLTRGNANDRQPAYSRDGEWVVFSSNRSGNLDLWQVSQRTGVVRRLTEDAAEDWDPAFMPDGRHVVWSSNRSGHFEVWMANADGSGAVQVTNDGVDAENPTATADGNWIVYVSTNPRKAGVWKVRPDGRDATRLIAGTFAMPEVSPEGRYALYSSNYLTGRVPLRVVEVATGASVPFEIEIAVPAGKPRVALGRARWMPDGRAIAFIGQDEEGVAGIYVQDFAPGRDTRASRRKLGGFDAELTTESFGISPDGSRMVIASWEQLFSLMLAERLPDIEPPERGGR